MLVSLRSTTIGVVALLCACQELDSPMAPPTQARKDGGICADSRPQMDGTAGDEVCVRFTFFEERQDFASKTDLPLATNLVWSGQSFDTYDQSLAECLPKILGVQFKLYIIEYGEYATFDVPGQLEKVSDDGFTVFGLPKASYALPPNMEIVSSTPAGKYSVRGGLLRGVCLDFRMRTLLGGVPIGGGWHRWYDYTGAAFMGPGQGSGGGGGRGWIWKNNEDGYTSGAGAGWQTAFNNYMSGQGCTRGWEIWIDGHQVCDSFGNAMS